MMSKMSPSLLLAQGIAVVAPDSVKWSHSGTYVCVTCAWTAAYAPPTLGALAWESVYGKISGNQWLGILLGVGRLDAMP